MTIKQFEAWAGENWPAVRQQLLDGTYRPAPVRRKTIPKEGGERLLGIPNVLDRLIQQATSQVLTPTFDPTFSESSFGFRPNRSAHGATKQVQKIIQRGHTHCVDVDLSKFFDNLDWDLVMRAVRHHTDVPWILLYVERWLRAPVQHADGRLEERTKGSPQGSVISPLLSNLFMHTSFDFLGFTFRPRRAKNRKGKLFISFLPGVSNKAAKSIRATIRSWRLGTTRNNQSLEEIAKFVNPFVRGWVNYYGRFYKSALTPVLRELERSLAYWVRRKFKRFARHARRAVHWLGNVARREPNLFVLWQIGIRPAAGQ
jgi:retron-type reverse transcriptase